MFDLCLTALISGVISVNSLMLEVDTNNGVIYSFDNKTQYILPDSYNLESCGNTRFVRDVNNAFDLVSTID